MKAATKLMLIVILLPTLAWSQADTTVVHTPNKKRLRAVVLTSGVTYTAAMVGLGELWYKDSHRQSFQFFNDNAEWKQMDKVGHFFSSFQLSHSFSRTLQWCDVKPSQSDWVGALTGFLVLVPIEIFDGYSDAYGASAGDLIADAAGPLFYLGQTSLWHEVRIHPKFSFHRTDFAAVRPELLGDDLISETIKDYNGQTYWLSVDMDKFIQFPKWLNIAVGYGAEQMVAARGGSPGFDPYRQYYLSLDLDLTAIRTKSKFLKTVIFVANMIKVPTPALSFSRKGTKFYALYF